MRKCVVGSGLGRVTEGTYPKGIFFRSQVKGLHSSACLVGDNGTERCFWARRGAILRGLFALNFLQGGRGSMSS